MDFEKHIVAEVEKLPIEELQPLGVDTIGLYD